MQVNKPTSHSQEGFSKQANTRAICKMHKYQDIYGYEQQTFMYK